MGGKMTVFDEDKLHEECGVFGIYAEEGYNVADDIYCGLVALQHRGQEAAGISVSDTAGPKGNLLTRKGVGLVSDVFSHEDVLHLQGNLGVGHVRYSTTGGSAPENAQPIAMNYIKGSLALVHNGNLINADALKQQQMYRGQAHYTTSDSEILAYEIINERLRSSSIEEAVRRSAGKIRGGYAVLVMSPRKLVGIRDPLGIKPLVLGQKDSAYILASESAAITAIGGKLIRDVEPGEVITITREGISGDAAAAGADYNDCRSCYGGDNTGDAPGCQAKIFSDRSLCAGQRAHCVRIVVFGLDSQRQAFSHCDGISESFFAVQGLLQKHSRYWAPNPEYGEVRGCS